MYKRQAIYRGNLSFPALPVPVRKKMGGVLMLVPAGTIHIISVLWKSGKVADTKVAAAAWPVGIVRSRLAQIVIARPHELSDYPTVIILHLPVIIRKITPGAILRVIAGALAIGVWIVVAGTHLNRELLHATGADGRCRL